jgi:PPOX class probable F420-dependent enzyme
MKERLASEPNAWMTTLRPDGSPHVTPVWFVFLDETWWVCSSERSAKVRNIAADPRVALVLEDGDAPVVAEGEAVLWRGGYPPEVVAAFAAKYDWDITTPFEHGGERVVFEVPVRRWLLSGVAQ